MRGTTGVVLVIAIDWMFIDWYCQLLFGLPCFNLHAVHGCPFWQHSNAVLCLPWYCVQLLIVSAAPVQTPSAAVSPSCNLLHCNLLHCNLLH